MFGFFKRNKGPFNAKILPLGKTITVKGGSSENLLKAALENGLSWPYNCRVGSCGSCKCKLVSGDIKPLNDFSYVLTGEELDQGYILACQTMVRSDIEVEVALEAGGAELAKARRLEGRISRIESLTHDILDVGIELEGEFRDYLPGQYADIVVPGVIDKARSYSFSRSPSHEKPNNVSFFIRRVPNGTLTEWLHSGNRVGDRVVVDGPHGAFYLRDPAGSILLVAGGSGLAPIRALLQQIVEERRKEKVTLIFGARTRQDLYCLDEIDGLAQQLNGQFRFLPVLSQETLEDGWTGATGHCPDAISGDMLGSSDGQAYLCGPPVMVDVAVNRLKGLGITDSQIFFDKFLDASSMPGGRS